MMMEVLAAAALWLPLLLLLSGAGTAEAHGGGSSASSTGPAWAATTRAVMVGANGRVFSPNRTVASVGDVVEFSFYPGNHSVVRSAYMFPCVPFETTGAGKTGFWSGFFDDKSQTPGRWRLTITDTTPIFFYSSGPDDCNRYGMVGGINVDPGELQMQHDMAVDSPAVVQPTVASSPNGGPSGPGTPTSSEPSPPPSSGVAPGVITGMAEGVVAFSTCTTQSFGGSNDGGDNEDNGNSGTAATSKATAELGSMLNGTAPSLFPYNNDRCVLEARGGGAVATSFPAGGGDGGREPSELSG
ncbi:hypothetical protein MAPG_01988 [Magnaporthiopsis poae ATCC 64411]|uniref:Extracellular serine-rich protein n=1 Tax=Magnaporthiopsis poae (strain ATCC 64411 / 73-15) TaxID=644358 RepID=A0A0C4DQ50_MAGP6|nr:hypothetical protein MAPG_01988 [Magnaporthiopsis poae ATCC 64411]